MKKSRLDWRVLVVLYFLGTVLLWEWFIPITKLSDFGHTSIFLVYIISYFTMALLKLRWWTSGILQLLYVVWALQYMFYDKLILSVPTLQPMLEEVNENIRRLIHGDVGELTNFFRTVLLFLLIWMIAYLIRHWIEVRKSLMFFFAITVIFIALLDTFSPYDATWAMIRIMVFGLLAVGLLALLQTASTYRISIRPKRFILVSLPLVLAIAAAGVLAKQLPVQPPAWKDPVPYLKSIGGGNEEGGALGPSRVGYDPDDSQLGGAFIQDNRLVFEADVDRRLYWKIETKDTYTSKGWVQYAANEFSSFHTNELMAPALEGEVQTAKLTMFERLPYLLYPYGVQKFHHSPPLAFMHEEDASRMYAISGQQYEIERYTMEYVSPEYTLSELKAAEMHDFETVQEPINAYLQLPDVLPKRVKELALSITENKTSVYDKAKAIEQYFGRNGFSYNHEDVALPGEEDDYVDQFLFDTKRGYCDNFSTSMAVMLRAVGIPSRWVKGFAPGERVTKTTGESVYQVTNNEAHSWVEAYIPNVGWVPFEPTIGFYGTMDIEYDLPDERAEQVPVKEQEPPSQEKKDIDQRDAKTFSSANWLSAQFWKIIAASAGLLLVGWLIYRYRAKWNPKWQIRKLRYQPDGWQKFEKQYNVLLKQLEHRGVVREPGMTLSAYAAGVDAHYGGTSMRQLTEVYEKGIYGNNKEEQNWNQLNEVWEDLIIRTND